MVTGPHDLDACFLLSLRGRGIEPGIADWLRNGLGGVILFARNVGDGTATRERTDALRSLRPDVVVAVDEEGGDVTRLEAAGGSSWPGNAALGQVGDPALTERVAAAVARQVGGAGANLDLAPDTDVHTLAVNPVIGTRAFGAEPGPVAAHTAAWVRGMQGAGVAACAKHFPGHGATVTDSHLDLPLVDLDPAELRRVHLAPFAAAVDAGVAAVMTAHVRYPALDAGPATTSARIVTGILREEYGFDGVVVSDALGMGAIAGTVGVVDGAVAALRAGVDLLCLDVAPDAGRAVRRACAEAVDADPALRRHVAAAARRVAALAARFPGGRHPVGDGTPVDDADRALGATVARRAVTADGGPLPDCRAGVVVIEPARPGGGVGRVPARFVSALRAAGVAVSEAGTGDGPPAAAVIARLAAGRPVLCVVADAHRRPADADLVAAVVAAVGAARTVVIETGLPLGPTPAPRLSTFGGGRVNLAAAAELLTGRAP